MARTPNPQGGYNGNPNLPLPTEDYTLAESELEEYVKCLNDPLYFIANFVKITQVDEGIITFKPWKFQETVIHALETNRFVIAKLPRQSGKSTVIICGYFLWYILFHTDVSVALLANKEETAIMLLDRLKESFELLPRFLKQGVEKWDQKLIKLGNKARVRAAACSGSAIRGDTFNIVFLDEFAFVPANIAEEFMASVFPVISSGKTTKLFIVSTPNGFNLFHKIFVQAEQGKNDYKALQYTWRDVFYAKNPTATETEALKWRSDTIKNMANNEQKFQQEFECDFLGSANSLVAPWKLAQIDFREPLEHRGKLRVYQKPIHLSEDGPAHVYVCTVDVAQGQLLDSSVVQVIDITSSPFVQVGCYQDNSIKPAQLGQVVVQIARWYNDAFLFFEINGEALATALICQEDFQYENIIHVFMHKKKGQQLSAGFTPTARIGLKSTEATKRIGCTGLKSLLEGDKLVIVDYETKAQLGTFVAQINKRTGLPTIYGAELGNHDDCISPLVLLGWLSLQQGFENYIGKPMRQHLAGEDPGSNPILELPIAGYFDVDANHIQTVDVTPGGYPVVNDSDFWLS